MKFGDFFRKLLGIPVKEYRELFRRYTEAEASVSSHIRDILPYKPLSSTVMYQPSPIVYCGRNVCKFIPYEHNTIAGMAGRRGLRIESLGITEDDYDNCLLLFQRVESAVLQGDKSRATAICDTIEEIADSSKAQKLKDALKKQRTIIKKI